MNAASFESGGLTGVMTLLVAVFVGFVIAWIQIIRSWRRGEPMVPFEPRREVPWLPVDAAIIFLVLLIVRDGGMRLLGDDPPEASKVVFFVASNLVLAIVALTYLAIARRAGTSDLGLILRRLPSDLLLGFKAFAAVSVPIFALNFLVSRLFRTPESEHVLLTMLRESSDWRLNMLIVCAAIISAPLFEEIMFRLILQGSLEKIDPPENLKESTVGPARGGWIALTVAAAIFAIVHWSWDIIPLFFFALALGYLYRQTHRITPSIVAHFCLNAFTIAYVLLARFAGLPLTP